MGALKGRPLKGPFTGAGATLSRASKLFEAIISNDINRVKYLLDRGADINSIYMDETTLMSTTNNAMLVFLIQSGADLNLQISDGSTAAHHTAVQNDDSMLLILMNAGINMNIRDKNGWTPLMWACRWSAVMNIKNIINYGMRGKLKGVDDLTEYLNAKDNFGKTAINMISKDFSNWPGWHKVIRKMLRNAGADDIILENVGFLPIRTDSEDPPVNMILYEPIEENDEMIDFNGEYNRGRYYKKTAFNLLPDPKKNPFTGKKITNARTYKAKIIRDKAIENSKQNNRRLGKTRKN